VLEIIPNLEAGTFGLVTVFHADGSLLENDFPKVCGEIGRLLKVGGIVMVCPRDKSWVMPDNFKFVSEGFGWLVAVKTL